MENLILYIANTIVRRLSPTRKFRNQSIENTGCSALMFSNNDFKKSITPSGDHLYYKEFKEKGVSYGIICIQLNHHYERKEAMGLLRIYINKLKGPFFILHNTGLQKCIDWNSLDSKTLTDYWQDADQRDWKVKGYTDGKTMAVLYVKNISQIAVKKQDLFLDGFHFRQAV